MHPLFYLVYEVLSCYPVLLILQGFCLPFKPRFYFVGSFFPAARTDFRHHISLTPSRIDLGKMERSMGRRIMSGNVTEEGAAAASKQSNLVEDQNGGGGEANSSSSSSFAHRLYNKVTKW